MSHEVFEAANAILKANGQEKGIGNNTNKYKNRYAMSGKLICGECGRKFVNRKQNIVIITGNGFANTGKSIATIIGKNYVKNLPSVTKIIGKKSLNRKQSIVKSIEKKFINGKQSIAKSTEKKFVNGRLNIVKPIKRCFVEEMPGIMKRTTVSYFYESGHSVITGRLFYCGAVFLNVKILVV